MFKFFYCVFIGFFLLVGTNCINPVNFFKGGAGTGGIYGKLEINKFDKRRGRVGTYSPTLGTLSISGTNLSVKPDSTGIFYFPEVEPGSHTIVASAPSVTDSEYVLEEVEVSVDSISILEHISLNLRGRTGKYAWDGTKIKRIDVQRTGSMVGKMTDIDTGLPIPDAHVFVTGTFWRGVSDSSGKYNIKGILPGVYMVVGQATLSYRLCEFYDVRIAPDTMSVVNFRLETMIMPEGPAKKKWTEKFIKQ